MEKQQKIAIIFLLAFSVFVCVESWRLGVGSFSAPGPGFLSFGAALAIFLLSLFQASKAWGRDFLKRETPSLWGNKANVLYILGGIFAFPLLLSRAGFLLCTFLFTGYCLKIIAPQKWRVVLTMSFGVTIVSHMIFNIWLSIQLPRGTWVNQFLGLATSLWK
jgi:putative tricarboxylic transport membrane protein